jgi:hypothetical protein
VNEPEDPGNWTVKLVEHERDAGGTFLAIIASSNGPPSLAVHSLRDHVTFGAVSGSLCFSMFMGRW